MHKKIIHGYQICRRSITIKKAIFISICSLILLSSCKTVDTTNNSEQHAVQYKPTQAEIDNMLEGILNNDSSELSMESRKFMAEIVKKAMDSPETLVSDIQKAMDNMLYVYPNPSSGAVTVEFAHNFPFKSVDINLKNGISLDLYYMETKINTLEFSSVKDNKVTISSDYLKKEGTYTVSITGLNSVFTSFVVKR